MKKNSLLTVSVWMMLFVALFIGALIGGVASHLYFEHKSQTDPTSRSYCPCKH